MKALHSIILLVLLIQPVFATEYLSQETPNLKEIARQSLLDAANLYNEGPLNTSQDILNLRKELSDTNPKGVCRMIIDSDYKVVIDTISMEDCLGEQIKKIPRTDNGLIGQSLKNQRDPKGKKYFHHIVLASKYNDEGFVNYTSKDITYKFSTNIRKLEIKQMVAQYIRIEDLIFIAFYER